MHTFFPHGWDDLVYTVFYLTVFGDHFPMPLNILRIYFYQLFNIPSCIIELFIEFERAEDLQGLSEIDIQSWGGR